MSLSLYRSCAALTPRYKLVNGNELYDLRGRPGRDAGSCNEASGCCGPIAKRVRNVVPGCLCQPRIRAATNSFGYAARKSCDADAPGLARTTGGMGRERSGPLGSAGGEFGTLHRSHSAFIQRPRRGRLISGSATWPLEFPNRSSLSLVQ